MSQAKERMDAALLLVAYMKTEGQSIAPKTTAVPETHTVMYKVTSTSSVVELAFRNENGEEEQHTLIVPWDKQFVADSGQLVMLRVRNSQVAATVTCSIFVDGKEIAAGTDTGERALAYCDGSVP